MQNKVNQKKVRVLVWLASFFTLVGLAVYVIYPYTSTYLSLPGFSSATKLQFYGQHVSMGRVLPTSPNYVVNGKGEDLIDMAADLGVNLMRLTNGNEGGSVYKQEQWDTVLNKMQSKGMKALILIDVGYLTRDMPPQYLDLVQKYIDSGVFAHPDVYAVDIKNEPGLTDVNVNLLHQAHDMIKAKYPDLKQTIGGWSVPKGPNESPDWLDFPAGKKLADIVDFYSLHMYAGINSTKPPIGLNPGARAKLFLRQALDGLQTDKPILVEEFGETNGDTISDQDTIGSPELQAKVYQGVFQALAEMQNSQILGAVAFELYSRNKIPSAWALIKDNGDYLFPAARILQAYALGKDLSALKDATTVTSQSHLMRNVHKDSIQTAHVSDRIGFKLQLEKGKEYSTFLSTNGILQMVTPLHYEKRAGSYYAVYKAIKKGNVQLNITPDANCAATRTCTDLVYTLTVNVL